MANSGFWAKIEGILYLLGEALDNFERNIKRLLASYLFKICAAVILPLFLGGVILVALFDLRWLNFDFQVSDFFAALFSWPFRIYLLAGLMVGSSALIVTILSPVWRFVRSFFPPFDGESFSGYPVKVGSKTLLFRERLIPTGFRGLIRVPWIILDDLTGIGTLFRVLGSFFNKILYFLGDLTEEELKKMSLEDRRRLLSEVSNTLGSHNPF